MDMNISRRFLLAGSASLAAGGVVACTNSSSAEEKGAFTPENAEVENPYLLGAPEGIALLSRNENPYGPSKSALKMLDYASRKGAYYTSRDAIMDLKKMIASKWGLTPEHIALTTGSGEALSAIAMIYGPNGPIVAPRLFWDTTALYAKRLGMAEIDRVPLTAGMDVDLAGIEAKVTETTGLVQLCNPNNPTGLVTPADVIKPAVKRMAAKTTVIVDEAYMELADAPEATSCIDLVKEGHDVIVTRTFSKIYGMAGIRMGDAIAKPEVAEKIQMTAMSWSPCTSYAAALGCFEDEAFIKFSKGKIVEARQMVMTTLDTLGLEYLPSQTNFVYFKSGKEANDVQKAFADKKISVRGQYMDYNEWTRVSMGFIEDVDRFCKALPAIVGA